MNDLGVMNKVMPTLAERDKQLEELWNLFLQVPVDPDTGVLEEDFGFFPHGTKRDEVLTWFTERHSKGVSHLLISDGVDRTYDVAELTYRKTMCFECMSECCTFNPKGGICLYPLVHGKIPVQKEDYGCMGCCINDDDPNIGATGINRRVLLSTQIEKLDFSVRTYNCLRRAGFKTVSDIVSKTEDEMMRVRNLGRTALEEIITLLAELGLSLADEEV